MSGHSKWATIKRKKGKLDAERGRMFTRLIKEITVAARSGGGDPEGNPRLRTAVAAGKAANMPADNIKRAIMKGTGELPGTTYEETTYEGYGIAGVAIFMEAVTDNKNRTVAEIRHIFTRFGGNLGENGCVSWMFDKRGIITVDANVSDEDTLMEIALDAGAIDMSKEGAVYEIITPWGEVDKIREAISKKSIPIASSEVTMIPQNYIKLNEKQAESMLKLYEALEEHEDVQKVHANFDIDEKVMEKLAG